MHVFWISAHEVSVSDFPNQHKAEKAPNEADRLVAQLIEESKSMPVPDPMLRLAEQLQIQLDETPARPVKPD